MTREVDAIVVTYNSVGLVDRCLLSILAQRDVSCRIMVVDNASSDDTVTRVRDLFPSVVIVQMSENGGYACGINAGAKLGNSEFLLAINPDVELGADALYHLASSLEDRSDAAIAGGQQTFPDGRWQRSHRHEPSLPYSALSLTGLPLVAQAARRRTWGRFPPRRVRTVDYVDGAAMLIRRSMFNAIGGLDESYFHYCEEIDLARRLRIRGWSSLFIPRARIVHDRGGSSTRLEGLNPYVRRQVLSLIRFADTKYGPKAARVYRFLERLRAKELRALSRLSLSMPGSHQVQRRRERHRALIEMDAAWAQGGQ